MTATAADLPRITMPDLSPHFLQSSPSPESDVQIWIARVSAISADQLADLAASLDAAERARAERFRFERDRKNYVAARGLLRSIVGAATGQPAPEIVFDYGAHGKPVVAESKTMPRLHFNLSHADGWAIFALSSERELGIDLETNVAGADRDLAGVAARVLSARELNVWNALPDFAARSAAFLRAWTRKEACLKAMGKGLHIEPREIEVFLNADLSATSPITPNFLGQNETIPDCIVHDLAVPAGLIGALAVETPRSS